MWTVAGIGQCCANHYKHAKFANRDKEEEDAVIETPPTARPSTGDSDGRPLMGFDEVDGPVRNLEETWEEPDWNV